MEVHVELVTGEVLVGIVVEEDDEHIYLKWSKEKKMSILAKSHIKAIRWTEIDIY